MAIAEALKVWTPPQLAKRYGVSTDKVVRWILAGELAAMNLATVTTGRPRYKVKDEAVEAFEARRAILSTPPRPPRKKRLPDDFVRHFR